VSLFADPICAVVAEPTAARLLVALREAQRQSLTVELRLDWLADARELERALNSLPKQLAWVQKSRKRRLTIIATLRRREAGGKYSGSIVKQLANLLRAAESGCRWCDLEIESVSQISANQLGELRSSGARLLISFHDFEQTPADLGAIVNRLYAAGGNAIKIAGQCHSYADSVRVLATARRRKDVVAVPMGESGAAARILALRASSALAYASISESTAPGQLSVGAMRECYRADQLDSHTKVFAIIGNRVAHSLSPTVHNAGYAARRINAVYVPAPVEDLSDFLKSAPALGIAGFSVTIPHKQAILQHLNACDPLASRIGAVNTVVVYRSQLLGYNTDYSGVIRALQPYRPFNTALILGAGGAARAAAFALADAGVAVSICARKPERARVLARASGTQAIARSDLRRARFDLIINATPVGMDGAASPLRQDELNCRIVMDMVYHPLETPLLKLARKRRIKAISGLEMFLAQAADQWEIWLKSRAPVNIMRRAALQALAPHATKDASVGRAHSHNKP
jgi:3-dehydroquinate dehydratase / shikimate dehydrogenase